MSRLLVTQRPASPADQDFLLRVFASTRVTELAQVRGGTAARAAHVRLQFHAQALYYRQHWPTSDDAVVEVVLRDAMLPVGRLWTDRRADSIHVLDIALLPEWRGRGVGSVCLERLQREASQGNRVLTLQVRLGNPARGLYERLGFVCTGPQDGLHLWMEWRQVQNARCIYGESRSVSQSPP